MQQPVSALRVTCTDPTSRFYSDAQLEEFLAASRAGFDLWAPHPDYPGVEVSTAGLVRRDCELLRQFPSGKGYLFVNVGGKRRPVHQLVLETYICSRPPGLEGCHYNGIKEDNRLWNLRWDTPKANAADRRRHHRAQKRADFAAYQVHLRALIAADLEQAHT